MEKVQELMQELAKERARSERLRRLLDKTCSEAAHFKRVLQDYQEGEQKRTGKEKAKEEEIWRLQRELEAIKYSKEFLKMGMREDKALETARSFLDKDEETFHENIALLVKEVRKDAQDEAIQKFLSEHHKEVHAGFGDSEYSSAENIALKHVRNIKVNENDLESFK